MKLNKYLAASMLFLGLFSSVADSQPVKIDSTTRPGNFQLKISQYKMFKNAATDVIFLGNSITAGVDWNELLDLPQARNRGISGDVTFGVLERLDEVIEGKPAKVFILIGINDISRNIPDSIILRNYQQIISRIKSGSPRTKVYFQTVLPVNNTVLPMKNHYNKDQHIAAVNEGLKALATKERITCIDLHPRFIDSEGKLMKEYTVDGLHLNAKGYEVWAAILKPYLK
jgi:lysophospholipase L1-like esterase